MADKKDRKGSDPCPLCRGLEAKTLLSARTAQMRFRLVQCPACGLAFTVPAPEDECLPSHLFKTYYGSGESKFFFPIQYIRNRIMGIRARHYLSLIPKPIRSPRVLDVGCAEGRLLNAFLGFGFECLGIEHPLYPSSRFIHRERIVYLQDLSGIFDLHEGRFHLIFLWHTLEHLDDPRSIMIRLGSLLAPGGAIVLAVPNFSSIESQSFGRHWFHLDIPWHRSHFNKASLRYLVGKSNLRIAGISSFCLEQGPYGLVQSLLNAMGWPRNEFYEFLKGRQGKGRILPLIMQGFILTLFLAPAVILHLGTCVGGKGPILKMIVRHREGARSRC